MAPLRCSNWSVRRDSGGAPLGDDDQAPRLTGHLTSMYRPLVAMDDFGQDQDQSAADLIVKPMPAPAHYRHGNVLAGLRYAPIQPSFAVEQRVRDGHPPHIGSRSTGSLTGLS